MKVSNSIRFNFEPSKNNNINKKNKTQYKNIDLNSDYIAHLNKSAVSFGAMKKSQFSGIDLLVVNQFKLPIQNFKNNDDFQNYCQLILDEEYLGDENVNKISSSIDNQAEIQKKDIYKDWVNYTTVENTAYTPSIRLLILSSITKNLNSKSNHLPPVLDKRKLADTLQEISDKSKSQKNYSCNFDKLYRNNLMNEIFTTESEIDENLNGWIRIDSEYNDPDNFEANVKKLQTLSHDSWCTKTYNAEPYLREGDFHIYFEKGKPKVGMRFEGEFVVEIQGEKNDGNIPLYYLPEIENHIKKDYLYATSDCEYNLKESHIKKEYLDKFVEQIGIDTVKNKEYEKILPFFGIKAIKDKDGMLILDNYNFTNSDNSFNLEDLGLNCDELLEQVKAIYGDACFDSNVTSTGNVEIIKGNLSFKDSKIKDLGKIRKILGSLDLTGSLVPLKNAIKLEKIGKVLITPKGKKINSPALLLKTTPLSRPLTLAEYSARAEYKLNTAQEIELFIDLIDKEGESPEEAAYQVGYSKLWA